MRRLRSNSRKNRIYKVFREVGRSVRTVALLRYLAIREVMVYTFTPCAQGDIRRGASGWVIATVRWCRVAARGCR